MLRGVMLQLAIISALAEARDEGEPIWLGRRRLAPETPVLRTAHSGELRQSLSWDEVLVDDLTECRSKRAKKQRRKASRAKHRRNVKRRGY